VISSWVIALRAPNTLKRFRPAGALMNKRVKDHKNPTDYNGFWGREKYLR